MQTFLCRLTTLCVVILSTACSTPTPTAIQKTVVPVATQPVATYVPNTVTPGAPTQSATRTPHSLPTALTSSTRATTRCLPTHADDLSPSYKPDAPVRSKVGQGHVLTGVVRSGRDCQPMPNAQVELWSEEPGLGHPDDYRATIFTDAAGAYRFECNPTDHIHMRVSAEGYRTFASNAYHTEGRAEGTFDIVLSPL